MSTRYRILIQLGAIIAIILVLGYVFSSIVTYVIISVIIATILTPITDLLTTFRFYNFRIPRAFAVFISFLLFIAVVSAISLVFSPLLVSQIQTISNINFTDMLTSIREPIANFEAYLLSTGFVDQPEGFLIENLENFTVSDIVTFSPTEILNDVIRITSNFVVSLLAVGFITFFLIYEKGLLKNLIIRSVPNAYFELTIAAVYRIERNLTSYLLGLVLEILALFTLVSVGLTLLGIKYALTIAFFAAIIHLIPYLGSVLGIAFSLFVSITTADDLVIGEDLVWFIAKILIVHLISIFIDNVFLQPLIYSRSVKAHPLEVFIVIFAGAAVAGAVGMIAAIPVYTIIRVSVMQLLVGLKEYQVFRLNQLPLQKK